MLLCSHLPRETYGAEKLGPPLKKPPGSWSGATNGLSGRKYLLKSHVSPWPTLGLRKQIVCHFTRSTCAHAVISGFRISVHIQKVVKRSIRCPGPEGTASICHLLQQSQTCLQSVHRFPLREPPDSASGGVWKFAFVFICLWKQKAVCTGIYAAPRSHNIMSPLRTLNLHHRYQPDRRCRVNATSMTSFLFWKDLCICVSTQWEQSVRLPWRPSVCTSAGER